MLRYLNRGTRQFGEWPIHAHKRPNWEFYAVLKGRCGILLEEHPKPPLKKQRRYPLRQSHLWVFPPQHFHGWYGVPDASCEIVVFHFNSVPALLERAFGESAFLEVALDEAQGRELKRLARALEPDYRRPSQLGNLRAERALLDLCLLALAHASLDDLSTMEQKSNAKVEAALSWFARHLSESPSLEAVAAAVHVSPTHLRRLFAQFHGTSPHEALREIQLEAAARLLAETDEKLATIAAECGFSNSSNLCRAFRTHRGYSPNRWRKILPSYDQAHRGFLKAASSGTKSLSSGERSKLTVAPD